MNHWLRAFAVVAALGVVACGVTEPEQGELVQLESLAPTAEEEFLGQTQQEITASDEFYWHQSYPYHVPLGPVGDRVCFLTGVSGNFMGGGEWVHVYTANGSWYLGGNSVQTGVSGRARCVPVGGTNWYTQEFSWQQGQPAVNLGTTQGGRTCFLTRMVGRYMGGGEVIKTYINGDSWYLGGGSLQVDVGASARCVFSTGTGGEIGWTQGNGPTFVGDYFDRACFLTLVAGRFSSGNEWVNISDRFYNSPQTYWYLGGGSTQYDVTAYTRCINDPIAPPPCGVSTACWDGSTVSCQSNTCNVQRTSTSVTCDGARYSCPPQTCTAMVECISGDIVSCTSNTGNCSSTSRSVTCDGRTRTCPRTCSTCSTL
jgi:hypothetical protein